MKRRIFRSLFFLILISCLAPLACQQKNSKTEQATEIIEKFIRESRIAGLAVTVGKNNQLLWSQGFGFADVEQQVPVRPATTLFRVGSVAKPLTATAVALLYEQGKLDLDAPIQKYVPDFPQKRGEITTRLLAGHLAGVRHYRGMEFLSQKKYPTVAEGLAIFAEDTLLFMPGSEYSYSSYGWNLVSAVVEGASGQPFLPFMDERIFEPMGLHHTTADHVDSIIVGRGRYYMLNDTTLVNAPPVDNSYKWAGGGFLSTSEDLVRFGCASLNNELLKPETTKMIWTSQQTTAGEKTNYGIGWASGTNEAGRDWVGHNGGSVGGSTYFRIYPEEHLVIALIANMSNLGYGEVPDKLVEIFVAE